MPSSSKKGKGRTLFTLSSDLLTCRVLVKSKQDHKLLEMAVDTGACFTVIPNQAAYRLGLDPTKSQEKEAIITANGLIYAPVVEIPLMGALGIELHGFKVLCYDLPQESRVDGILGLDFLSYFPPYHTFREEILKIAPQFWKS